MNLFCGVLALVFSMAAQAAASGERPPVRSGGSDQAANRLIGTWDVTRVAVDLRDQPHWLYRPDDPRLLGRSLTIDEKQLRLNDGSANCPQPDWKTSGANLKQLIAESYPRSPRAGSSTSPSPADFGLRSAAAEALAVFKPVCAGANPKRTPEPWGNTWLALEAPDVLLMRMGSDALLVLARRAPGARPKASFACERASRPAEKAICGSIELAAWDRSVAAAWRRALKTGDAAQIKSEQAEWLRRRDACAADSACLEERMRERVDELSL